MPVTIDQQLVDAKIEAAEARTDTKFAQLIGRMDSFAESLSAIRGELKDIQADNRHTRGTVRNSAFALAALMIAMLALFATVIPATISWGQQHPATVAEAPAIQNGAAHL